MINLNKSNTTYTTNYFDSVSSFEALDLKVKLLQGLFSYGYTKPTDIQSKAILPLLARKDLIAQAQSGTGKTGAFLISALQIIDDSLPKLQVVIIAPTKELATQIFQVAKGLSEYLKTKIMLCTGGIKGMNYHDIKKNIKEGVQLAIVTPARLIDLVNKKIISYEDLKLMIVDEADEMLSRNFMDDMVKIVAEIPSNCQIGLFSATMTRTFLNYTSQFTKDPAYILIQKQDTMLEGIRQFKLDVEKDEWKMEYLMQIQSQSSTEQKIIFCKKKETVLKIACEFEKSKISVSTSASGPESDDMTQFKKGETSILISTDALARGIDIQSVSMVINFDMPNSWESYIHRIGRSGRHGRKGLAISFVNPGEKEFMNSMEHAYKKEIEKLPLDLSGLFN